MLYTNSLDHKNTVTKAEAWDALHSLPPAYKQELEKAKDVVAAAKNLARVDPKTWQSGYIEVSKQSFFQLTAAVDALNTK